MLLATLINRARTSRPGPPSIGGELPVSARQPLSGTQLVEAHYEFIWRLLRRMGLEPVDADDATQQVFMVTLYPEAKVIVPGSERSFLYGVALNVCREFRRKKLNAARHDDAELANQVATGSPQRDVEARQSWGRLQQVLSGMSEEVRAVFVLFELEGLTAPEIAEVVQIPAGTVASRLRRGREIFHEQAALLREALPEGSS